MARRKAPHIPDAMLDLLLSGTKARAAFGQLPSGDPGGI